MLAARLKEGGVVVVETVPIPEPKVGEARIQIIQGGICATDVELTRGYECVRSLVLFAALPSALSARALAHRGARDAGSRQARINDVRWQVQGRRVEPYAGT